MSDAAGHANHTAEGSVESAASTGESTITGVLAQKRAIKFFWHDDYIL